MEGCKVLNKGDFTKQLIILCNQSATKGLTQGAAFMAEQIEQMLKTAQSSSEPTQQTQLLSDAIDEMHKASSTKYGKWLNRIFNPNAKKLMFNPDHTKTPEINAVSSTFEEMAKSGQQLRQRNFLESQFKNAPNAKLYFRRNIKNDMVETFLVSRSGAVPKYFTSQEEMNLNTRLYKQQLLDRIFDYFNNDPMLKSQVATLPKTMYSDGTYTGVIEQLKPFLNSHLSPKTFTQQGVKQLDSYYMDYRDKKDVQAKRFLDAYNAWFTLQHFDTIVEDSIGTIVRINGNTKNKHTGDLTKYEIRGKATNMWKNWTATDDITDMAEVISDVTQMLVDTSRMYQWGNDEAFPDRYLSFNDFNHVIGIIKKLPFDPNLPDVTLNTDTLPDLTNTSVYTRRTLLEILSYNRVNGNLQRNADGSLTNLPKEVTFKQLISRINENPQRYLHAIFDIMCNTNILDNYKINDFEKNLIWSFNKEIFGGENETRSLYKLHNDTKQDNIYQILTQVAASTFPEDYLQYYEKNDGSISTRLLQGYALDRIKDEILSNIRQTARTFTLSQFREFGMTKKEQVRNNIKYLLETKVSIPIEDGLTFNIESGINNVEVYFSDSSRERLTSNASKIWNHPKVQKLFKDVLGLNLDIDPDFKNAYLEIVKSEYDALQDLGQLTGRVLFNIAVNSFYAPKPEGTGATTLIKNFIREQYGSDLAPKYEFGLDKYKRIPLIPVNAKDVLIGNLAMAYAINSNLLAQAQSKTGEGTSLANFTLSRMRNFYQNQLEVQCKKSTSALKDLSFVVNTNGLFEGILSRRELKTKTTNQQSIKFSDQESYELSFINDFIAGFVPNQDDLSFIKNGKVSFLPMVPSDKVQIDGLPVNLRAQSRIPKEGGGFKTYMELTDEEIEQEMINEFKPMYDRIINNINTELTKVYNLLSDPVKNANPISTRGSVITNNESLLKALNNAFKDDVNLGKNIGERVTNGLHKLTTRYNKTHSRNPIMLSPHVHYIIDKKLGLVSNKTLESLWGRFNPEMDNKTRAKLSALYKNETDYQAYLSRNGLDDMLSTKSFFKYKEHLTVKNLLRIGFRVPLYGSDEKVRADQPEIKFLKGQAQFNKKQLESPDFKHIVDLNNQMKNWVDYESGYMIIAKGDVDGKRINITNLEELNKATNLEIHPMISKLNRLDYLCTQQYTIATVGSHYAHKGKSKEGSILVEEAQRWLASNKRNVAATSTVHLFQNKQIDGPPSIYNVSIIEDIRFDLYNVMGDLYLEGHAPLDGGMFVNGFMPDLENNALAGEAAGLDKKQFGTFFSELYGAGGIVKTAGFAATNARMRRSKAWQNLQKAMSNRVWVKEVADELGNDIPEVIDITKDYFGNNIDWKQVIKSHVMYKRPAHDNSKQLAAYRLHDIKSLGNNQYEIYEIEIDQYGNPVTGEIIRRIEPYFDENNNIVENTAITINNNWDLYTKVFGGYNSLETGNDGKLTWSENSRKLMVHAINNIGYRKDISHISEEDFGQLGDDLQDKLQGLNSKTTGLDQDDVWQPLKYSDVHYTPNIGAIKSLQFNVNPDGNAVLEGKAELNHFSMRLAQLGIQLDKEHHADAAEVSMPTQIIQATANRSYTSDYSKEIYTALSTLTRQSIQPFLDGIDKIITSDDPSQLVESVTSLIVDNLLHQSGEDSSANAILADLLVKADQGKELKYHEDIKGKVPYSDPTITNKLFSSLATTLTNLAVKMKFDGTLSVICPTDGVEKFHGDRMLNTFTDVVDASGSTRTTLTEDALDAYQASVKAGQEFDSDGRNMLVFDLGRDMIKFPSKEQGETNEQYQERIRRYALRKRLSQVSELKAQHNYVIEFADGSTEYITINTPTEYYRVKNLVTNGRKSEELRKYEKPLTYDDILQNNINQVIQNYDFSDNPYSVVYEALATRAITRESFLKETGLGKREADSLIGLFKTKAKGGVSIERLAEQIWEENKNLFNSDQEVRNLIIEIVSRAKTKGDINSYMQRLIEQTAKQLTEVEYAQYSNDILTKYGLDIDSYSLYYNQLESQYIPVRKIYEDVQRGRSLAAYNVRFSSKVTEWDMNDTQRFQIFDLDSINTLFNLNALNSDFEKLSDIEQQQLLNKIFKSPITPVVPILERLRQQFDKTIPNFDENFVVNLKASHPDQFIEIINTFRKIAKPFVYNKMQQDLFKLSDIYDKPDRSVYVNGELIEPMDIKVDAYELIMPKIYQTQFGLQEFDELQDILRDPDFFVKRGLSRFACKLAHTDYDYELKNFNGDHIYVLDKSKGIPDHIAQSLISINTDKRGKKLYRTDNDNNIIYELSSDTDAVCDLGGVQVIVTDNPLFYVQNLNYNTLKVSPKRVTEESYQNLIGTLKESKRQNSKNFVKAITDSRTGQYFDLNTFKEFNKEMDELTYEKVRIDSSSATQFKSTAQICKIILQNGKELHTAFNESLNLIAGRIPAQSQQSFMTQRVIAFDNSDINTAMVSTFQLFLQGSDLDIDAVTLLGYQFDKNGKFVSWSPYFNTTSKENLEASKNMPLPTGQIKKIQASTKAPNNFFEIYDKYFGTLFTTIPLGDTEEVKNKTVDGVPQLQINTYTPEQLKLLADFLRDFNKYGINIKAPVMDDLVYVDPNTNSNFYDAPNVILEDGTEIKRNWKLFTPADQGGIGAKNKHTYQMALQLLNFANTHNNYLNVADEHLKAKMAKNYIVHYIYKVSGSPCNQTEGMESVDTSVAAYTDEADRSEMSTMANSYAPGGLETKHMLIGENQAGKAGVGIGAVGIKANSTTQFYISELLNYGSDWDKQKIMFKTPVIIRGKVYEGFSNMYTAKEFTDEERLKYQKALNYMNQLTSEDQITENVAINIASLLSLAVDNAKALALAKVNAGPKMMGMHVYGLTLGIPIKTLCEIMNSTEGKILKEMMEGSTFNNDASAFKLLDVFNKLDGDISGDLNQFQHFARDNKNQVLQVAYTAKIGKNNKSYKSTKDVLFALMYDSYMQWYSINRKYLPRNSSNNIPNSATSIGPMIKQLIQLNAFESVLNTAMYTNATKFDAFKNNLKTANQEAYLNWNAAFNEMLKYIKDINQKAYLFKYGNYGKDLKVLAQGAEEMRILGSILSINKGLKATISDTETFIDTIENLIYNRKQILGQKVSDADKIDFHKFMTDPEYQKKVVDAYEEVKHSVNIPHLIMKVPHFQGYLKTQMIPTSAWMTMSVKYRTVHKYRKNAWADTNPDVTQSLFKMFGVDGKRDKESILRGLENLIQYKLFTRWGYDNQLHFKVPEGFEYFTKKVSAATEDSGLVPAKSELSLPLYTDAGLASFKKYMEEVFIPQLQRNPHYSNNEFVKNLTKIGFDKTPLHNEVVTYTLHGDLMARNGRQAELNQKMFADFQHLAGIVFQDNMSVADAFFIYSQYCYMGKKGKKSLMALFDSANSVGALHKSFNNHIANMDTNGNISCSVEELKVWCAPEGNQFSKANWAYVTDPDEAGVSLKAKVQENTHMTDEQREASENAQYEQDENGEGGYVPKPKKFVNYKQDYNWSFYDQATKDHFLVPSTNEKVAFNVEMPITLYGLQEIASLSIKQDMIQNITLPYNLKKIIDQKIKNRDITKFKTSNEFEENLREVLRSVNVPYKVSLYTDSKRDLDFGILQTIIEQQINC